MDLSDMIIQFAKDFPAAMWKFLWVLGAVVGTVYVGTALLRMARASRLPGQSPVTIGDILPVIVIAGLMLNLSTFINKAWNSLAAGTITYGPVAYARAAEFGKFAGAINAALSIASVAGGCYFFKGLLLLKKASLEGQSSQGADDSVWRALTHMMGVVLIVQIGETIERFRQSFHLFW
ncbi:hypothetical protein AAKU55_003048 [Oxalobacteraceae bacterium GrIS 1.11]